MIATLNPKGRAGVVLPHGVLFRGGAEGKVRKGILEEDLLEAVIGLPSNLFFGAGIPACLFILNKSKSKERKGKVFFLYGANEYLKGKNQNKLRQEDIAKIVEAYREYKAIKKYSRSTSLDEIRANDYNLNITRYIDVAEEEEPVDVQRVLDELMGLKEERSKIETKMNRFLQELGYRA
jgi:type I restriction enzyme M protein